MLLGTFVLSAMEITDNKDRASRLCDPTQIVHHAGKTVVERGGVADEKVILDIASTLLRVEDRLDRQLIRLIDPKTHAQAATDEDIEPEDAADYQAVAESVMRECIINLARIKETVSQSLESAAPSQGLDSIPSLVRGIKAGLFRPITLWPFPEKRVAALAKQAKAIIVPELNLGQMNLEVERVAKGNCVVVHEGRVDGDPLNPGQIMTKVKEVL